MTRSTIPGHHFDNWVDILEYLATERPAAKAFGYLTDGELDEVQLSNATLAQQARSIGNALRDLGAQGERVLLLYPPGLDFIAAFLGCLYSGAVAVPAYPPDPTRLARSLPRLQAIAADAQTTCVLTTAMIHGMAGALFDIAPEFGTMRWLATDTLTDTSPQWRRPAVHADTLALLQYTSGSTGTPKGVMLNHGHLLHNSKCIQLGFDHSEHSSGVCWLPLYHDMGLIGGVLQPLYAGGPCTLLSPLDFLRRPLRWLRAVSRFRATTSGGPNFAYDLCVRKITAAERATLDLSSWRIAPVGAEPVRRETLDRFCEAFRECGFRREALYPCYGLAEATLFVSGGHLGSMANTLMAKTDRLAQGQVEETQSSADHGRELLSCGRVVPDVQVVIADSEHGTRCADGRIGEIWVSGPSVALGYWNRRQETQEIFGAALADEGTGPFLRTGDLGFLRAGELFVTGRSKDLIILRGKNVYPQDIELTVEHSHAAVRPGCTAAFSLDLDGEERLAVAAEVQHKRGTASAVAKEELDEIAAAVAEAIASEHDVLPQVVLLLPPGAIPKTSSGKIQRSSCRAAYLAKDLEIFSDYSTGGEAGVSKMAPRTPVEDLVASVWCELLNLEFVSPFANFFDLGGQSLLAAQLLSRLRVLCGVDVPMRTLFTSPTVAGLARFIEQALQHGKPRVEPPLLAVPRTSDLPLSFGQQRLWFLAQLHPSSGRHNVAAALRIEGPIDAQALEQATTEIIRRHEVLRTVFPGTDGIPRPVILPPFRAALPVVDVTSGELPKHYHADATQSFDLAAGPLLRTRLLRLSAQTHVFLLTLHHIIADGLSVGLFLRELGALHAAFTAGQPSLRSALPELPLQYSDYASWQRQWLAGDVLSTQLTYWKKQLAGAPPYLDLPTDRPRPAQRTDGSGSSSLQLPIDLLTELNALSRREGVTLFMTLLAAFQLLLQRYSGQDDIVVGTPVGGRSHTETERLIGFFANTLLLRTQLQGDPTVRELLARVRDVTLDAYAHQDFPLDRLVEELGAGGDLSRNPLFQVMLVMHPALENDAWPGCSVRLEPISAGAEFDLHLSVMPTRDGLSCNLSYPTDLFVRETTDGMMREWQGLLRQFVTDPSQRISTATRQVSSNTLEIHIISSFTADPLAEVLAVWMADLSVLSRIRVAPSGQVFQQLLDRTSAPLQNKRGANVVLVRLSDWMTAESGSAPERIVDEFVVALRSASERCAVPHIVALCPPPPALQLLPGRHAQLQHMEEMLATALLGVRGVLLIKEDEPRALYPVSEVHDDYADKLGQLPYTPEYFASLGTLLARKLTNLLAAPYKVIVTDCDQTLWKGIVGEVGPEGIEIDEPHQFLQEFLVAQHEAGMLLCLCSKNNEADVAEAFAHHPEMPLRREHILAQRINWHSKAENLDSLAKELQLGLDSFVFLDDSAIECAEVRARCPQVMTLELPMDARRIPEMLRRVWAFDHFKTSQEDRQRTQLYRQNMQREHMRATAPTLSEFVASLELDVRVRALTDVELERASQLTQRTNQFNCSVVRRTEGELRQLIATGELEGWVVDVKDRFGDYGLVGLLLCARTPPALRVDTFLLSCRALGRGVEVQMLAWVGALARSHSLDSIQLRYRRTSKNQPALEFLRMIGGIFREDGEVAGHYELASSAAAQLDPAHYLSRADGSAPGAEIAGEKAPAQRAMVVPDRVWATPDLIADVLDKVRATRPRHPVIRAPFVAARTPQEELVASIWSQVLGVEPIGVFDSFFALGGHSLLATQVVSRLRTRCGVELPLRAVFEAPTVAALASLVETARRDTANLQVLAIVARRRSSDLALPLSFAQQRLWFLERLQPDSARYNGAAAVRLLGNMNVGSLQQCLNELVARHESLRTTFPDQDGVPYQQIGAPAAVRLRLCELSEADVGPWLEDELQQPFDLARGPLLRAALARLSASEHVLVLTMHHIISDGWSVGVIVRELSALYRAFSQGLPSPLKEPEFQYADYALWQKEWLSGDVLAAQLAYWKQQLHQAPPALDLPTDHPRPSVQTYRGASVNWRLSPALSRDIEALSTREGVTLFMTLLAALNTVLSRYTGQEDIVVGTPIAGRTLVTMEGLVGLCANTLALRTNLAGDPSVHELLQRVRATTLDAYAHQDLPFEKLVDELSPVRDLSRSPLYQVMLVLQNAPTPELAVDGVTIRPLDIESKTAKCDLTLSVSAGADGLFGAIEYSTDLFESSTILRLLGHWQTLLAGMVAYPMQRISQLPLITDSERNQLLWQWNSTLKAYPHACSVYELFERQAKHAPDACAVVFQGQHLSYRALNERASALADRLRVLGVRPEVRVALCLDRSVDLLVAILGILKAGGAYVPLDPNYPPVRRDFILKDADAALLLTQTSLRERFGTGGPRLVCIDALDEAEQRSAAVDAHRPVAPQDAAYVIYTSGSTGNPKGVVIEHHSVVAFCYWARTVFSDAEFAGVLASTSICFDLSIFELLTPLCWGGRVVLVENALTLPAPSSALDIALINTVPSVLVAMLRSGGIPDSVLTVNLAGEPLRQALVDQVYQHKHVQRVLNLYGPSECTTYSTYTVVAPNAVPNIGRPIDNTQAYVLDHRLQPLPIGVPGELYLGGAGVARGYLNRPELTSERFVPDPFGSAPEGRLYKTGDLCRWLADGTLEFLGRSDHQVKLNGFRIELGEIEAALLGHAAIREAVVVMREDPETDKRLVAYFVPRSGEQVSPAELRSHLQRTLPAYMIPAQFVALAAMPLNANGKVERRALPPPDVRRSQGERRSVPPRSAVEQTLAEVWQAVLRIDNVGVEDNFFALGGDSILAIQVTSRAKKAGLGISVRQLFEYQTIAQLARVATTQPDRWAEQGPTSGAVTLTPIQRWFFSQQFEEPHHFNQAVLLAVEAQLDPAALTAAVRLLVQHHDALRLRYAGIGAAATQSCAASDESVAVQVLDLSSVSSSDATRIMQRQAAETQASLSLVHGPLMRVVWFDRGSGRDGRLLLVIHHLAVDGVSWRILLEDLEAAYTQALRGETLRLAPKTTSFQCWADRLAAHACTESVQQQRSYWQSLPRAIPLPRDFNSQPSSVASAQSIEVTLDADETRALLQEIPSVYRTEINDLLLSALLLALAQWTGQTRLRFDLEGHGREEISPELDLSRTVGWFTTLYPVNLELPQGSLGAVIKGVKEQLRRIPQHGLGYGLLRYLQEDERAGEELQAADGADVRFNYLGQFDGDEARSNLFRWTNEDTGPTQSPNALRTHALDINGFVYGGQLRVAWTYSKDLHQRTTIDSVAQRFVAALRALVAHCQASDAGGRVPSDYPMVTLSQATVDRLAGNGRSVEDIYPLSPMQGGLLFHTLRDQSSTAYVQQLTFRVMDGLQVSAFALSWKQLLARHTILRTGFVWEGLDEPLQVVRTRVELPWSEYDLRQESPSQREGRLTEFLQEDRRRGFDLAAAPLLRLTLLRLDDQAYQVVWTFHHLLLDGWSLPLLFSELFAFYEAAGTGATLRLPCARPYREYIRWLQQQDWEQAEAFWRQALRGFTTPTKLPIGRPSPADSPPSFAEYSERLSAAETEQVERFARSQDLTVNTVLQGAFGLLLRRYTGEQDVVFGATQSGRAGTLSELATRVGLFINTTPVRVQWRDEATVAACLRDLQSQQAAQLPHAYVPLRDIQSWCEIPRGQSLFETLWVMENYPVDDALQKGPFPLSVTAAQVVEQNNYPLTLTVLPGVQLTLRCSYDSGRFDSASMQRMLGHYRTLLLGMVAEPEARVSTLELLTAAELQQLLVEFNATRTADAGEHPIHTLFEAQAEKTPNSVAVAFDDVRVTYYELNRQANQLAHYLRRQGVGPDVLVGICMERSPQMVVGLLAILKAGGAYVPLDASHPKERLGFMLRDTEASLLLTQAHLMDRFPVTGIRALCLDTDWATLASEDTRNPEGGAGPDHLAYVIYTSGSTGQPKGTLIPHRGLANYLNYCLKTYDVAGGEGAPVHSSLGFDLTVTALWAPLLAGRTIFLLPEQHSLEGIVEVMQGQQALSLLKLTPSHVGLLEQLLPSDAASHTRALVIGGEALFAEQLKFFRRHAPNARLFNEYGPTETVVGCCVYEAPALGDAQGPVPIGRPIANTQVYVLDQAMRPVPMGIPGELYIGGAGLARGYLHRPELTAERFVRNPFSRDADARLYRTSDLCRWRSDGNLEFLGRSDQQVKLRGHRIELGEIECALMEHPAVREAAVLLREDMHGLPRLVAYVQPRHAVCPSESELRSHLLRTLPDYMVPTVFVCMPALPLSDNGKVDRRALPMPEPKAVDVAPVTLTPTTKAEELLAQIWSQVLGIRSVGQTDNFFELGGDSILAIQVMGKARQAGMRLSLRDLFRYPSIAALARMVSADSDANADGEPESGPVVLTPIQRWFFDLRLEKPEHFNQALLLEVRGTLQFDALQQAVQSLVAHHDALRLRFISQGTTTEQLIAATDESVQVRACDLSAVADADLAAAIASIAQDTHAGLNLQRGPLVSVAWMDQGSHRTGRLLIVIHHLAVDGVSWRILLEDLETAYGQACQDQTIRLPRKTTSFRRWAAWLNQHAQSDALGQELAFWRLLPGAEPLPVDCRAGENSVRSTRMVSAALSEQETRRLLLQIPARYSAEITDALLTALLMSLSPWLGSRRIRIDLEHHGRHELSPELDVSGTVGWFTAVFPAVLELRSDRPAEALLAIREQRRQIPNNGLGYGLLRYLREDTKAAAELAQTRPAEVSFNYLGQLDNSLAGSSIFGVAREPVGPTQNPATLRTHILEINAWVLGGSLQVQWLYSDNRHQQVTLNSLAQRFLEVLRAFLTEGQAVP